MDERDAMNDEQPMKTNRSTKPKSHNGRKVTPKTNVPASQRVVSESCPVCHRDTTHIYATRGLKRYCKCRHCGWTWAIADLGTTPAGPVSDTQ